ncbi:Uncharacterised protein [Salmonella enterica]|nr:Uncharacterised protein [Salmonella enterica]
MILTSSCFNNNSFGDKISLAPDIFSILFNMIDENTLFACVIISFFYSMYVYLFVIIYHSLIFLLPDYVLLH